MKQTSLFKNISTALVFFTVLLIGGVSNAAELVNLNKASAAAMQQNLIGIGPIKAEAIVSYRKKNGKFKSLDDLQNVTGLGPALIKKNKRYLSLSKGAVSGDDKAYAASKKQAGKSKTKSTKKNKQSTKKESKSKTAAKPAKNDKKSSDAKSKKAKKKSSDTKTKGTKKKASKKKKTKKSNPTS